MFDDIKLCFKYVVSLILYIIAIRLTFGVIVGVLVLLCLWWAIQRKYGLVAISLVYMTLTNVVTPAIVGADNLFRLLNRIAYLSVPMIAIMQCMVSHRQNKFPFAWLFIFLLYMCLPSAMGWFPVISYLKLGFFTIFAGGVVSLVYLVSNDRNTANVVRNVMLGVAVVSILGSAISWFFPSIGFSMQISKVVSAGVDVVGEEIFLREGINLFSGIFCHSQSCGPLLALLVAFLILDMFLVRNKITFFHTALIGIGVVLMFLTRSRTALLVLVSTFVLLSMLLREDSAFDHKLRKKMNTMFVIVLVCAVLCAIIMEVRNGTISAWLFKGSEVGKVSSVEALTSTRMGRVEESLSDFMRSPVFGMGFQVNELLLTLFETGRVNYFTAPVEKGVLPTMVLGEGGVIGFTIFTIFVMNFVVKCISRRLCGLLVMFVSFLAMNMGEAVFFSPSGDGGPAWVICVLGGVSLDIIVREMRNDKAKFRLRS